MTRKTLTAKGGRTAQLQASGRLPLRPPKGLGKHGREFWRKYVPLANALDLVRAVDVTAFLGMAQHYDLAMQAWDTIQAEGLFRRDENGVTRKHPATQVHRDSWAAVIKGLGLFGMHPLSRSSMSVAAEVVDDFDRFLLRRPPAWQEADWQGEQEEGEEADNNGS